MVSEGLPYQLIELINKEGEVELSKVVKTLKVEEKAVMDIARILGESRIIDVFYKVSGQVFLRKGLTFQQAFEDMVATDQIHINVSKENVEVKKDNFVDDFLAGVRTKRAEKISSSS